MVRVCLREKEWEQERMSGLVQAVVEAMELIRRAIKSEAIEHRRKNQAQRISDEERSFLGTATSHVDHTCGLTHRRSRVLLSGWA